MGDVNVNGWVWVCVACDIVKRVWESIQTHDLPPQVFNQTPDSLWASAPRERLALCRCTSAGANVSANNSLPFTKTLFCTVTCLFFFFFFFFFQENYGNSDLSVKTAPGISLISDEGLLFWPMAHRQSRLWADHQLQLEKFLLHIMIWQKKKNH